MDRNLEDLVRHSLQQRAEDVEPTPALWQEVDRRIARRRRLLVAGWALAGAAAVLLTVLVVPNLVAGPRVPEIGPADETPSPEPAPDDPTTDDPTADDAAPEPGPDDADLPGDGTAPALPGPVVTVADQRLLLVDADGVTTLVELPEEGESRFLAVSVRPGATSQDLTLVTTTTAEGMTDLRWTEVVAGEVAVPFETLGGAYAPTPGAVHVSGAVWAPDGSSLAWLEDGPGGPTLRTIGWTDAGPGTGDTATDNAAFQLDLDPGLGLEPQAWLPVPGSDEAFVLWATTAEPTDGWFEVPLLRQADGAWALSTPAREVTSPVPGNVVALAGVVDGSVDPAWLARVTDAGVEVVRDPFGAAASTTLPDGLLPGDGLPEVWLAAAGDDVLVGGRGTGVGHLVTRGGEVARLPVDAVHAAEVR